MRQTTEQKRAKAAWTAIEEASSKGFFLQYVSLVKGAPVHIRTSGFGQTMAFYRSRKLATHPEYGMLLRHLAAWLPVAPGTPQDPGKGLMGAVRTADTAKYRSLMAEAIAYLVWLKRFAAGHPKAQSESMPVPASPDA